MNLRVGFIGSSPGWEELLCQAGVPVLSPITPDSPRGAFSAIVAARRLDAAERAFVREYLKDGGAVFGSSLFLEGLIERTEEPVRLSYLAPDREGGIGGLSLLDVECTGWLPREANCMRTSENVYAVFAGELLGGLAVVAPFDPGEAMEDFRAAERYFYARQDRLPSERVSRVSKGELMHFVVRALEFLHHGRGIPFAQLSPIPAGTQSVFAFRIDTDAGTRSEIDDLYEISRDLNVPFSWFLDAGSHASWLGRFAEMERQEIGLHCYDHRIYLDAGKDEENIRRGVAAMKDAGLSPDSFAAPFGFLRPDLGRAIDNAGFRYSSEFAWAYDALPQFPVSAAGRFSTLQVPVHPVAIGSLLRSGYSPAQMSEYFHSVVAAKLMRREPLFFYHHPGHRQWDVVRDLCEHILECGARPVTMGEFALWWSRRRALRPVFRVVGGSVVTSVEEKSPSPGDCGVNVRISRRGGEEALVPLTGDDRGGEGLITPQYLPPSDILRVREFDLRGEIGRRFTRLQRRFP